MTPPACPPWPCWRCGQPGVRNLGTRGYCATHLTELYMTFTIAHIPRWEVADESEGPQP